MTDSAWAALAAMTICSTLILSVAAVTAYWLYLENR